MSNVTIQSKNGSQFHPMAMVVLVILCVPIAASGLYLLLLVLIGLLVLTFFKQKIVKLDLDTKHVKDGWFKGWEPLPENGYLSIFYETSRMAARARSQETVIAQKELFINYIVDKKKYRLYTASNENEAMEIAKKIAQKWKVRIYNANERQWIEN